MSKTVSSRSAYLRLFRGKKIQAEALKYAHEIRQFEIELYWKRATYFWTLIGATFVGYFAIDQFKTAASLDHRFLVASLGFILSFAWYLVSRGSKFWQQNWEKHLDLLEDDIAGPLHKTVLGRENLKFFELTSAYAYSPTRINQIVGLLVSSIWLVLLFKSADKASLCLDPLHSIQLWTFLILVVGVVCLLVFGQSSNDEKDIAVAGTTREFSKNKFER